MWSVGHQKGSRAELTLKGKLLLFRLKATDQEAVFDELWVSGGIVMCHCHYVKFAWTHGPPGSVYNNNNNTDTVGGI